jgi:hypothetical protein
MAYAEIQQWLMMQRQGCKYLNVGDIGIAGECDSSTLYRVLAVAQGVHLQKVNMDIIYFDRKYHRA